MITLSKIRLRNFMSYGGNWNELPLSENQLMAINGQNGNGKCLHPDTVVTIKTTPENQERFELDSVRSNIFNVTIGQLSKFFSHYPMNQDVFVLGRFGFHRVLGCQITALHSLVYQMTTETGRVIKGSPEHLLYSPKSGWTYLKDLTELCTVQTSTGIETVVNNVLLDQCLDLYDLSVEHVHEYFANGVVSHNSSFISALTFALFNKSFNGASKGQLVNSINGKQLEVEVYFDVDTDHYKVVRGIKPNIFQIYKNDKLLNEASNSRDYQSILENQILKMSFKTFIQTVVVGTASYTPFMELNANDRRIIVEDLLGVGILTTMNQVLKQKISDNNQSLQNNHYELQVIKNELQNGKVTVNTLKQAHQNNINQLQDQLKKIETQIDKHNDNIKKINVKIEKLNQALTKYDQLKNAKQQLIQQKTEVQTLLNQISKRLTFINQHETCPTCNQIIDPKFKQSIIEDNTKKQSDQQSQLQTLSTKLDKLLEKETKFIEAVSKLNDLNNVMRDQNNAITMLNNQHTAIVNQINQPDNTEKIETIENQLRERILDAKSLMEVKESLLNDKDVLEHCGILLKDNGIKTAVVNQYLPIINQMVNKYLADMEFYLSFELDNQFNETIKARGRDDLSYQNLSQGERRRLDMAIMFTWRYIAQLRNSCNCNNIFVDEILDSSLDQTGIESIMKLFKSFDNSHIIVISHRESVQDLDFDKVVTVTKRDQFSNIEYE